MSESKELIEKAEIFWLDGDLEAAKKILDGVIADKTNVANHAEAFMFLGHVLESQDKYDESLIAFKRAIELNKIGKSNFVEAYTHYGIGKVLKHSQNMSDIESAISHLKKSIHLYDKSSEKILPAYRESSVNMLILAYLLGDHVEEAERCLNVAIKNKELPLEDLAENFMNLGHIFYKRENFSKAISLYERAVMTQPRDRMLKAEIYNFLGRAFYMIKDYEKAKEQFELSLPLLKKGDEFYDTTRQFMDKIKKFTS